jgi:hypothetical protein
MQFIARLKFELDYLGSTHKRVSLKIFKLDSAQLDYIPNPNYNRTGGRHGSDEGEHCQACRCQVEAQRPTMESREADRLGRVARWWT